MKTRIRFGLLLTRSTAAPHASWAHAAPQPSEPRRAIFEMEDAALVGENMITCAPARSDPIGARCPRVASCAPAKV